MNKKDTFMVFDVESVGLHGEGFAVAYVVVDGAGDEKESGLFRCDHEHAFGTGEDRAWVEGNVPLKGGSALASTYGDGLGSQSPKDVRSRFWNRWMVWRGHAMMAADCPWPVEARFLIECVRDDPRARNWTGPYPLIDVASVRLAAGFDPLESVDRLERELPVHDPLADARQSARLLIEALDSIKSKAL